MTRTTTPLPNILFACTHNKIRSPMAEALTKTMYPSKIAHIDSCGIDDGGGIGDGFTIAVMQEIGIDLQDHTPKAFTARTSPEIDLVICFSEASFETANQIPALDKAEITYCPVYDPQLIAEARAMRLDAYRNIRDTIKTMLIERFGTPDI